MIESEIKIAAATISAGGIVLYPTDTIWGIGCDATNPESIQKIYHIKQRTDSKSMLVLVNSISMLEDCLETVPSLALEIIEEAEKPSTIIYPGARNLAANLVAPDGSVGIRLTSDPFCRKLIEKTGLPIVSTSANISGAPSPANFHEISTFIREQVDYVVKWRQDDTVPAAPSAILKLEMDGTITILRP